MRDTLTMNRSCGVCGGAIEGQAVYSDRVTTMDYSFTTPRQVRMPCHSACVAAVTGGRVVTISPPNPLGVVEDAVTRAEHFETLRADPQRGTLILIERHLADVASNS